MKLVGMLLGRKMKKIALILSIFTTSITWATGPDCTEWDARNGGPIGDPVDKYYVAMTETHERAHASLHLRSDGPTFFELVYEQPIVTNKGSRWTNFTTRVSREKLDSVTEFMKLMTKVQKKEETFPMKLVIRARQEAEFDYRACEHTGRIYYYCSAYLRIQHDSMREMKILNGTNLGMSVDNPEDCEQLLPRYEWSEIE